MTLRARERVPPGSVVLPTSRDCTRRTQALVVRGVGLSLAALATAGACAPRSLDAPPASVTITPPTATAPRVAVAETAGGASPTALEATASPPGVRCGSVACSGATPLCCWDAEAQRGSCAAERCLVEEHQVWSFGCTSRRDCSGDDYCCRIVGFPATCSADCNQAPAVCEDIADCPDHHWGHPLMECRPDPNTPTQIGSCEYDYES